MAYNSEVVRRARQRLESAKADKESLYRQRLEIVYSQLPRVRQIDIQLRKSMVLATQAVFSGDAGAQDALEEVTWFTKTTIGRRIYSWRKQTIERHSAEKLCSS